MFINLNQFKTSSVYKAISSLFLDFTATNTLDDRVTFSRTSNATVTNSAGLVSYAPHNLLTFSEQFDNAAWTKSSATISANTIIAPDGTLTGDKLVEDTTTNTHFFQVTAYSIGITQTLSIYAKSAGNARYLQFGGGGLGGNVECPVFDLDNGTVDLGTTTTVLKSASITPVGNGWYRCSAVLIPSANLLQILLSNSATTNSSVSYTGDGTSGIFLWGAQLEIGSTATTYNPTTVKNLLGFTEAFDNAAWTKSNSFVQTNLITYSQDLDNAAWIKNESSVTTNSTTAPNGTNTAETIIENSASGVHVAFQYSFIAVVTVYTLSVFMKANTRNFGMVRVGGGNFPSNIGPAIKVDLTNGTVTTIAGTIISSSATSVGNGWYRCTMSFTSGSTTDHTPQFGPHDNGSLTTYTGNGTGSIFAWGAQLVQGSVAGDYRRTDAAALPVFYPNQNNVVCAEKLVENTVATAGHNLANNITVTSGVVYTQSYYVKAAERSKVQIRRSTGSGLPSSPSIIFDLSNGTYSGTLASGWINPVINSAGNGWYRIGITITANATGSDAALLAICDNTGNPIYTGDGTSGVYVFGAQLSDSASLDPYVLNAAAAPTAAAYYGPRFDYDPVTLQPKGLLIEEQRTNLVTYSDDFSNAAWIKYAGSVTGNTNISPDGTLTADTYTADGINALHRMEQTATAGAKTFSIYAKASSNNFIQILWAADATPFANFNLATGVVGTTGGSTTASITSVGNGWYRCIAYTSSATATNPTIAIISSASAIRGENNTLATSIFIWGAQLEAGAFATSYIPTVASQVTRTADNASIVGSNFYSWYNQNEGTMYSDTQRIGSVSTGFPRVVSINDGTANNEIATLWANVSSKLYGVVVNGGSTQADIGYSSQTQTSNYKTTIAYKVNDFAFDSNAGAIQTDTSGTVPIVNNLSIGNIAASSQINGTIKQISYYNTRLSNSTLQSITS
jgi:hypothetical protein